MKAFLIAILMLGSFLAHSDNSQWKQEFQQRLIKAVKEVDPRLDPEEKAKIAIDKMTEIFSEEREILAKALTAQGYNLLSIGSGALATNLVLSAHHASSPLLTFVGAVLAGYGCRAVFQNRPEAWQARKQEIRKTVSAHLRHFFE